MIACMFQTLASVSCTFQTLRFLPSEAGEPSRTKHHTHKLNQTSSLGPHLVLCSFYQQQPWISRMLTQVPLTFEVCCGSLRVVNPNSASSYSKMVLCPAHTSQQPAPAFSPPALMLLAHNSLHIWNLWLSSQHFPHRLPHCKFSFLVFSLCFVLRSPSYLIHNVINHD